MTAATTAPEVQAVLDGDHDDQLRELSAAIHKRQLRLDPLPAIEEVVALWREVDAGRSAATADDRLRLGTALNGRAKRLQSDYADIPLVQKVLMALRRDLFIHLLGLDPRSWPVRLEFGEED